VPAHVVDEIVRGPLPREEPGIDELDVDPARPDPELAAGHGPEVLDVPDSRMASERLEDVGVVLQGDGHVDVPGADGEGPFEGGAAHDDELDPRLLELCADGPDVVQDQGITPRARFLEVARSSARLGKGLPLGGSGTKSWSRTRVACSSRSSW